MSYQYLARDGWIQAESGGNHAPGYVVNVACAVHDPRSRCHAPADAPQKVAAFERLSTAEKNLLIQALVDQRRENLQTFLDELEKSIQRDIVKILVIALHGQTAVVTSVDAAVAFIESYDEAVLVEGFVRYELQVEYSNSDKITCNFAEKRTALMFLQGLH